MKKNELVTGIVERVVANPRIGPVPNLNRMIPVMIDVKFESKMALKAFL